METYKEENKRMDEMFRKAREEKPLLNLDEVKNVLPANQPLIPHGKGLHFSISHVIIVSGIVISSGLAYMTIKKDKTDTAPKTENTIQLPVETSKENSLSNKISTPSSTPATPLNNAIASTDKKLISPPVVDRHKKVALNEEYTPSEKFTTTTNITRDGKEFKVTIVGASKVVDIVINGVSIAPEEFGQYSEIVEIAKGAAEARIKEEGDKKFLMNFFDKKLRTDKMLSDENHYIFQLTDKELLIDGTAQSDAMFEKYSRFFKEQTGKEVAKGDQYQFKMSRKQLENKDVYGFKVKGDK
jgi:hypothetical protein